MKTESCLSYSSQHPPGTTEATKSLNIPKFLRIAKCILSSLSLFSDLQWIKHRLFQKDTGLLFVPQLALAGEERMLNLVVSPLPGDISSLMDSGDSVSLFSWAPRRLPGNSSAQLQHLFTNLWSRYLDVVLALDLPNFLLTRIASSGSSISYDIIHGSYKNNLKSSLQKGYGSFVREVTRQKDGKGNG